MTIKPVPGTTWAARTRPVRLRANCRKPHGSRQLYACYSIGEDRLWGTIEPAKGSAPTLRAIQSIRAHLDDGEWIYVILDNLNHHLHRGVREWCDANRVELDFTPTYASWANPIEAHFGPLRQFVIANSDHADHPALARAIRAYLHWRSIHTREPRVLPPSPHPQNNNAVGATPNTPPHSARTFEVRGLAAGDERHNDVGGVTVEVLPTMVIDRGSSGVGVAGGDLYVAKRDPGVEAAMMNAARSMCG